MSNADQRKTSPQKETFVSKGEDQKIKNEAEIIGTVLSSSESSCPQAIQHLLALPWAVLACFANAPVAAPQCASCHHMASDMVYVAASFAGSFAGSDRCSYLRVLGGGFAGCIRWGWGSVAGAVAVAVCGEGRMPSSRG
jgi:hypothetical protein